MPGKDIGPGGKGYGLAGAIAYRAVGLGLKLSRLPLVGAIIDRVAAKKRLKVVTIPVGAALKSNPAVLPFDAAKRLIEASSYIAVTDTCLCRESHRCEDYPVSLGCLFLGQGARTMSLHGRIHPSREKTRWRTSNGRGRLAWSTT